VNRQPEPAGQPGGARACDESAQRPRCGPASKFAPAGRAGVRQSRCEERRHGCHGRASGDSSRLGAFSSAKARSARRRPQTGRASCDLQVRGSLLDHRAGREPRDDRRFCRRHWQLRLRNGTPRSIRLSGRGANRAVPPSRSIQTALPARPDSRLPGSLSGLGSATAAATVNVATAPSSAAFLRFRTSRCQWACKSQWAHADCQCAAVAAPPRPAALARWTSGARRPSADEENSAILLEEYHLPVVAPVLSRGFFLGKRF
jgi:hypothetical protein